MKTIGKNRDLSAALNSVFSPLSSPVARVSQGEEVQIETYDAFGDIVRPGHELAKVLESDETLLDNPITGPVYIEGAKKGDVLAVDVIDIKVPDRGVTVVIPGFGGLEGWLTKSPPLTKFSSLRNGLIHYMRDDGKELLIPVKPFIGTIGVAPPVEAVSSLTPSKHGGNMDAPEVCPGNRIYFPVSVDGALFGIGDVHARQGDGEICGTAVEVSAIVTLKFHVMKSRVIEWPRIESRDEIMTVCSARPLEDAARLAFLELIQWLTAEYGFTKYDAYMLLSLTATARIAQIVDPLYTVVVKISKEFLK